MHKTFRVVLSAFLACTIALSTVALSACGPDGGKTPATTAVTGVNITDEDFTLAPEETKQLTANVTPEDATNKNVLWESDDTTVATVSDSGLVTAVAEGVAIITVTSEDGNFEDYVGVTVATPKTTLMELSSTIGTATNTLTLYTDGTFELSGSGVSLPMPSGEVILSFIEPTTNDYIVDKENNSFTLSATKKIKIDMLGTPADFDLLQSFSLTDKGAALTVYVNNGTADINVGIFNFTKEQLTELGLDADATFAVYTATGIKDTFAFMSDGTAVLHAEDTSEALQGVVGHVDFTTTWKVTDNTLTIDMAHAETTVMTRPAEFDFYTFVTVTGKGLTITVKADNTDGGDPANGMDIATFNVSIADAAKLGVTVTPKPVESISLSKETIDLQSGEAIDVATLVTITPADATDSDVSIALKEAGEIVKISSLAPTTITAYKECTAVIIVTVADKTKELTVNVSYPENKYENAVKFAEETTFAGKITQTAGDFTLTSTYTLVFGTDGMLTYSQDTGMGVITVLGYYTQKLTDGKLTAIDVSLFTSPAQEYTFSYANTNGKETLTCSTLGDGTLTKATAGAFAEETVFQTAPLEFGGMTIYIEFTFKADGTYTFVHYFGVPAVTETGTYTYDSATGMLTTTPVTTDNADGTYMSALDKVTVSANADGVLSFQAGDNILTVVTK